MRVVRSSDARTRRAREEWFTGAVWLNPAPAEPPDAGAFRVHFEPGARTNWHTHPEGQILYVLTGNGRAQKEGEPIIDFGPGDVVSFAPDEKHWHGAAPDSFMVHIAINPAANSDGGTEWLEPVTDEEYSADAG